MRNYQDRPSVNAELADKQEDETFEIDVFLYDEDHDSTRTEFFFNGELMGYGIEDEYRNQKVFGETRIPDGRYKMALRVSPKFSSSYYRDLEGNIISRGRRKTNKQKQTFSVQHELLWVKDVPGFKYILWHWGNTDDDTHGCYVVGSKLGVLGRQKAVLQSRAKYVEIYPILWKVLRSGKEVYVNYKRENSAGESLA